MNRKEMIVNIQKDWNENPHWENIKRTCGVGDAVCVNGLVHRAYANVRLGLEKLWNLSKEALKTNEVFRLSLITIILTLVVAIGGCYAQKGTIPQYQDNQSDRYNDEEGVEQEDQEEESKQYQKAAEQGDATAREWFTNTKYKIRDGGFVICTKEGVEKLHRKRLSQLETGETITTQSPRVLELVSNEEGCYFINTEVAFDKISEKYALPIEERLISHENGEENCPWNALERCKRVTAPAAHYVEAKFLGDDGQWYKDAFIEMGASFKLLDRPEDTQAGDTTPDNTLSQ